MDDLRNRTWSSRVWILLLFCVILTACEGEVGRKVQPTGAYYDVTGFLEQQLQWLDSLRPGVEKMTEADGVQEVGKISLDSLGWAKELEIFYRADINDPVLKGAYEKRETQESGKNTVVYKAKEAKSKVQWLKISYYNQSVTNIAALIQEDNALYKAKSYMELDFDATHNPPLLERYAIDESQKILFKDTAFYRIEGQLDW